MCLRSKVIFCAEQKPEGMASADDKFRNQSVSHSLRCWLTGEMYEEVLAISIFVVTSILNNGQSTWVSLLHSCMTTCFGRAEGIMQVEPLSVIRVKLDE